jgi:hypothetical protein
VAAIPLFPLYALIAWAGKLYFTLEIQFFFFLQTGMITLITLSTIHCDVAVNLATDLAENRTGFKLKYEGTLYTTEIQQSDDSVRTSGNSQLKNDRYNTDVDEVQKTDSDT